MGKISQGIFFVLLNSSKPNKTARIIAFLISALQDSISPLLKMAFCYQKCPDLLWEKNVLVIEKNFLNSKLKAENLQIFENTRIIYSSSGI